VLSQVEAVKKAVDEDMACFGTMDSWLIYQLTGGAGKGVHVTDGAHSVHVTDGAHSAF
jgi:glycerol kinase